MGIRMECKDASSSAVTALEGAGRSQTLDTQVPDFHPKPSPNEAGSEEASGFRLLTSLPDESWAEAYGYCTSGWSARPAAAPKYCAKLKALNSFVVLLAKLEFACHATTHRMSSVPMSSLLKSLAFAIVPLKHLRLVLSVCPSIEVRVVNFCT